MLHCSQPSQMSAGLRPRWISAATRLVGPLVGTEPAARSRIDFRAVTFPFPLKPPVVAAGASSYTMKIETLSVDFTDEQKRYLEGFTTGLQISRVGRGLGGANPGKANAEPSGPDAAHLRAQDKVLASGKKLADQEKFKREQHPFDAYPRLKEQALGNLVGGFVFTGLALYATFRPANPLTPASLPVVAQTPAE